LQDFSGKKVGDSSLTLRRCPERSEGTHSDYIKNGGDSSVADAPSE